MPQRLPGYDDAAAAALVGGLAEATRSPRLSSDERKVLLTIRKLLGNTEGARAGGLLRNAVKIGGNSIRYQPIHSMDQVLGIAEGIREHATILERSLEVLEGPGGEGFPIPEGMSRPEYRLQLQADIAILRKDHAQLGDVLEKLQKNPEALGVYAKEPSRLIKDLDHLTVSPSDRTKIRLTDDLRGRGVWTQPGDAGPRAGRTPADLMPPAAPETPLPVPGTVLEGPTSPVSTGAVVVGPTGETTVPTVPVSTPPRRGGRRAVLEKLRAAQRPKKPAPPPRLARLVSALKDKTAPGAEAVLEEAREKQRLNPLPLRGGGGPINPDDILGLAPRGDVRGYNPRLSRETLHVIRSPLPPTPAPVPRMTDLLEEVSQETNPENLRAIRNMGPGLFGRVGRAVKRAAGGLRGAKGPAAAGAAAAAVEGGTLARIGGTAASMVAPLAAVMLIRQLGEWAGMGPGMRAVQNAPIYTAPEQMLDYRLQQSQRAKMLQALQANPALMATLQKEAESQSRLAQGKGRGEIQLGGSPGGQFENPNALVDMLVNDNG